MFVKGYLYVVVDMLLFLFSSSFVPLLCINPCVLFDIGAHSGSATAIQRAQPCTVQHLFYALILLSIIPLQAVWFDFSAVLPLCTRNVF